MSWDEQAACRNAPVADLWFPDPANKKGILAAKSVCIKKCKVRRECGAAAIACDERFGVRGGYHLETERDSLKAFLRRAADSQVYRCASCGVEIGNARHSGQQCWCCIRGFVNAAPAQQRIAEMRDAEWTWPRIAQETGLNEATVKGIPRRNRISPATEQKVLAVAIKAVA